LRRVQKSFSFQRCHTLSFEARSKIVQFPEVPSSRLTRRTTRKFPCSRSDQN
jgi:hypothetical protein